VAKMECSSLGFWRPSGDWASRRGNNRQGNFERAELHAVPTTHCVI
jgi:hypothetical protein